MNKEEVIDILQERIYEWEKKPNDKRSYYYGCNERINSIIKNLKDSIGDMKEGDFPEYMIAIYGDLGIDLTHSITEHRILYSI